MQSNINLFFSLQCLSVIGWNSLVRYDIVTNTLDVISRHSDRFNIMDVLTIHKLKEPIIT